jgi:5-methylcytosine-specific restriction endonuclease McrA
MVFVLDRHKKPLMPCTPKRARLLLAARLAVVHRVQPFVIRLRDRELSDSTVQAIALKVDPGSKTSGMTLARLEQRAEGEVHHALLLAEVQHRGEQVHRHKITQAQARRRRRSANLRYRPPRFLNRRRKRGWLPPSLLSRVLNVLTWTARLSRWCPITRIDVEHVRFDTQLLQHPEITGVCYQQGELAGWETRAYLLFKYEYRCAYCRKTNVPFEVEHILPRSRGGSNRISNLCLACHVCNRAKGDRTATEFGHASVEASAKRPLRDAAAVNATRYQLVEALRVFGLPIGTWTGGRTRWNRARFEIEKTHALDALCVGAIAGVRPGKLKRLLIKATGRGDHCRTLWTEKGFPRAYKMRQKVVAGFATGDRVKAVVPPPRKTAGTHIGRVAVRKSRSFAISTSQGLVDGINAQYCRVVQRGDGYQYAIAYESRQGASSPALNKERLLPPLTEAEGSPQAEVL